MPKKETKKTDKELKSEPSEAEESNDDSKDKKQSGKRKASRAIVEKDGIFFDLDDSQKRRVRVSKFKGKVYVDFREYYEKDGEQLPGKKGIALTTQQWEQIKDLQNEIDEAIENM